MANNHMYAIDRSDEYLAHYGIKGMKWGVRKALESGNDRALARQYRKASRKLAKLQKQATSGKKYARRAAMLGAGAAAAGGLAAVGTQGVGKAIRAGGRTASYLAKPVGNTMHGAGMALMRSGNANVQKVGAALYRGGTDTINAEHAIRNIGTHAGNAVSRWGKGTELATGISNAAQNGLKGISKAGGGVVVEKGFRAAEAAGIKHPALALKNDLPKVTNNTIARIGAGAIGAGLAAGAGYNAYRAATTKRAAKRAAEFQREMNQAFKGTKYANGSNGSSSGNKKRRRR